jgi:hypothetical protein
MFILYIEVTCVFFIAFFIASKQLPSVSIKKKPTGLGVTVVILLYLTELKLYKLESLEIPVISPQLL